MLFRELVLPGVFLIEPEPHRDARGAFARVFCAESFAKQGLVSQFSQCSVSANTQGGTVRGMHYSAGPDAETKLVRCVSGSIFDVVLDLRPQSATFRQSVAFILTADDHRLLYIPAGFAHGFQTLTDDASVLYLIDRPFVAEAARGVRWNDPAFAINWPRPVSVISERDLNLPLLGDDTKYAMLPARGA
ncbi:dTDP-4-dehydrorhamnose 3,5-epimerase [Methylocapsa palsarum]|uniref:dTDP-4-dehydrorhamnose 3,5-epimerase n=1 Tax=Methylocapsa palsarum TaxID=1612308 RepID=A0A1I3WPS4_9HYPH|nr:dTDP-4-dehydrorhamnose 3,5-epimerase [Methylocapsa palsarum]SFK09515.1 dTDP-4-dehydrorhamnose 3,5-epimerase [Methylocapsa palsarum]